jgi:hypothetical protein
MHRIDNYGEQTITGGEPVMGQTTRQPHVRTYEQLMSS